MIESASGDAFTVSVSPDGVFVVCGDIDIAGGPILDAAILEREPCAADITVDVGSVSFIDSSGLRSLLSAARRARTLDGRVVLHNVGPEIARLLEITGTADQFVIGRNDG